MKNLFLNQNEVANHGIDTDFHQLYNKAITKYEEGNTLMVKQIIQQGMLPLLRFMNYVEYFVNPETNSYLDLASTHNIQDLVREAINDTI